MSIQEKQDICDIVSISKGHFDYLKYLYENDVLGMNMN